jgi:hypothetical protein
LPEQQHDAVTFGESDCAQQIGQLIGLPLYVAKGQLPDFAVGPFTDQGDFVRISSMAIANVGGNVVSRRNIPAKAP